MRWDRVLFCGTLKAEIPDPPESFKERLADRVLFCGPFLFLSPGIPSQVVFFGIIRVFLAVFAPVIRIISGPGVYFRPSTFFISRVPCPPGSDRAGGSFLFALCTGAGSLNTDCSRIGQKLFAAEFTMFFLHAVSPLPRHSYRRGLPRLKRRDLSPPIQNGIGILSYLKIFLRYFMNSSKKGIKR